MSDQSNEDKGENPLASEGSESEAAVAENKRLAARRRFMRMGAGASAGVMVTVVHKRAFAGAKKTASMQSLCGSTQTPDLTKANNKKALQPSMMGTPKGLVCVRQTKHDSCAYGPQTANYYTNPAGLPTGSPVFPTSGGPSLGIQPRFVQEGDFDDGCGTGNIQDSVNAAFNYRLYEKGWCPILYDSTTNKLSYGDPHAYQYFTKDSNGKFTGHDCQL